MKTIVLASLVAGLVGLAPTALADYVQPSAYCSKPFKPYQFNSELDYENWLSEVRRYRQCIENFVDEQNRAAAKHAAAADAAIEEWNYFVATELN